MKEIACAACGMSIREGEADPTNDNFHKICSSADVDWSIQDRRRFVMEQRQTPFLRRVTSWGEDDDGASAAILECGHETIFMIPPPLGRKALQCAQCLQEFVEKETKARV